MADQWYYTSEGRQMDPVSEGELKRLASRGLLKPTDLVWKEGMAKWERAGSHKDLFVSAPAKEDETSYTVKDEPRAAARADAEEETLSERLKRKRRVVQEDEIEDEEPEDYEERPRRRKKKKQSSAGLIWGVIGGAVALVAVIIGIIIIISSGESGPTRSWSLNKDGKRHYRLNFSQGKRVEIWVKSQQDSDVDLFVFPPGASAKFDGGNFQEVRAIGAVAHDDAVNKNCYVSFVAPASGSYEVVVWNRVLAPQMLPLAAKMNIRNQSNNGTMEFKESEAGAVAANPPANPPPGKPNLNPPPGDPGAPPPNFPKIGGKRPPTSMPFTLMKGLSTRASILSPLDGADPMRPDCHCKIFTVVLSAGKTYTIDMESKTVDSFLRLEDPTGQQVAENDDAGDNTNDARIVHQALQNGSYKIYASSFLPRQTGSFILKVKQE